jgi:S1-C subfamily serine protease
MTSEAHIPARVCPACGRRVPRRIEECRCGFRLGAADDSPSPLPGGAGGRSGAPVLAVGMLVVLAAAAFWMWPRSKTSEASTPQPAASAAAATSPVEKTAAVQVEAPPEDPEAPAGAGTPSWPANAPYLTREEVRPAPASEPLGAVTASAPRSLERAAAAVLPAIVLVETPGGRGTGFLVASDIALTNAHVVEGNGYVTLHFASGETVSARVAAIAAEQDLAVLRLGSARPGIQPLALGPLDRVRVGQEVLAVGSPHGLRNTVTRGIVSAVRRLGSVVLVQTDAAINPGNSGGPLVDADGTVVGIATMKVTGGAESLGFAVAADHARALIDSGSAALHAGASNRVSPVDLASGSPDTADTVRAAGAMRFERVMAEAARRADQLDEYWEGFSRSCLTRDARTGGDRAWFAIWERGFVPDAVAPACLADFQSFRRTANGLRQAIADADESARRAGVYPGSRRELLARYRLEWDGWEK